MQIQHETRPIGQEDAQARGAWRRAWCTMTRLGLRAAHRRRATHPRPNAAPENVVTGIVNPFVEPRAILGRSRAYRRQWRWWQQQQSGGRKIDRCGAGGPEMHVAGQGRTAMRTSQLHSPRSPGSGACAEPQSRIRSTILMFHPYPVLGHSGCLPWRDWKAPFAKKIRGGEI